MRYRSALYEGFQSLKQRPLCTDTSVVVCSRIKAVQMQIRRVPGTALANDQTQQIIYTPPVGETLLRDKLANWERFIHENTDVDPLIRMAVAHYQFEAIHPFTDGNGRTGRILNLLMLIEQGLLDLPVLYLSRYIIRHRSDYYRLLLDVTRHGHWAEWIHYMLAAVAETAAWTTAKIQAIRGLEAQARDYIRDHAPQGIQPRVGGCDFSTSRTAASRMSSTWWASRVRRPHVISRSLRILACCTTSARAKKKIIPTPGVPSFAIQ